MSLDFSHPEYTFRPGQWLIGGQMLFVALVLLFGAITVIGLNSLMCGRDDLMKPRNLIIVSVTLVLALGGIGLAGIVAVLLNLVLPRDMAKEEAET